eukprot:2297970-Prorocentrum_lima.AAC.1
MVSVQVSGKVRKNIPANIPPTMWDQYIVKRLIPAPNKRGVIANSHLTICEELSVWLSKHGIHDSQIALNAKGNESLSTVCRAIRLGVEISA